MNIISLKTLRDEISRHPFGVAAWAYKMGKSECGEKPEASLELQGEELVGRATIIKQRGNYVVFSW